jgi:tetratricopeptide (TPR) repeat protein
VSSLESIKERTEKAVSFVEWLAEVLRGKNWVTKLLLLDVLLVLFFSPAVLSRILGLLPKDLRPIPPELPGSYWTAFCLITGLVFVAALVVAYRTVPRKLGVPGALVEHTAIKFLRPFGFEDAEVFARLQREASLRECLATVTDRDFRFGVLCGESGCGKTSFLQAGLWPRLLKQNHRCVYVKFTEADPLDSVRQALAEESRQPPKGFAAADLPVVFATALPTGSPPLVLLFDQFEQFFVHRQRTEEREPFVKALAEWYGNRHGPPVRILICLRDDFYGRLIELQKAMGYSLGPQQSLRLEKFTPSEAAAVFRVVAETEGLPCNEEFVQELSARELASPEDGLVSAVDLQILAWVIRGQRSVEERAFNRTAFQRLGGLEGLLERFLSRALEVRETEARRQAALKVLLALTDLERNARAGVLSPKEIENRLARTMPFGEVRETLEWLARGDVRLATPVEREDGRGYELAHERLIPALRRLAGRELSAADQANQLLDRRVNEWLGNDRARRYLLTWRDWRRIRRHRPFLEWGTRKRQKEALLAQTRQYWRRCAGAAALLALLLLSAVGWWFSPWGQIWLVKRELGSLIGRVGDEAAHQAAVALYKAGAFERARRATEAMGDSRVKILALSALAGAAAEMGQPAKAAALFEQVRETVEGVSDPRGKVLALSDLAEAAAKIGDPAKASALIEQARQMADGIGDPRDKALTVGDLAEAAAMVDPAKSPLLVEQARQTVERMGDPGGKARTFRDLAAVAARLNDPARAATLIDQARQAAGEIGDPRDRSSMFTELAVNVMNTGDVVKAAALAEQGRQAAEEINDPRHKAERLKVVAGVRGAVGAWTAAGALLDESRQAADEIGDPRDKAWTLRGLAEAAAALKSPAKAVALIEQARQAAEGIGDRWDKARTLASLAEVTEEIDDPVRAAALIEQARKAAGDLGDTALTTPVPEDLTWLLRAHDPVKSLARVGAWRRARQVAQGYPMPDDRARALTTILEVWAEGGNPSLGSRPKGR